MDKTKKELYESSGLLGKTFKFTILADHSYDFYLQVAEYDGTVDFVALTCSGLHTHNIRALVELVCREATRGLRKGAYTLEELVSLWRAYRFEPSGACPQLEALVQSPLDAASIILARSYLKKGEV